MIYCGKSEFGQISQSFSLHSGAIRLKRSKNLTQVDVSSRRSIKFDRLLGLMMLGLSQTLMALSPTDLFEPGYHLSLSDDRTHLVTRYCADPLPSRLTREFRQARISGQPLLWLEGEDEPVRLSMQGNHSMTLPARASRGCVQWQAELDDLVEDRYNRWLDDDIWALSINRWWWRPHGQQVASMSDRHRDVTISLAPNHSVSAPWRALEPADGGSVRTNRARFRIPLKVNDRRGMLLIGDFLQRRLTPQPDSSMDVDLAILRSESALEPLVAQRLTGWLQHHLDNLWLAYGQWPTARLQLIVIPTQGAVASAGYHLPGEISPVSWAEVLRGHGPAILAMVDVGRDAAALRQDWTLTHELSHLLHPILPGSMRWVYEGIGSYYQNVLRARSGDLSEQQAWQQLFDGFERGRANSTNGTRLSDGMRQAGGIMRVYWSGVALALMSDVQLRIDSDNRMSLDLSLKRLKACCIREHLVVSSDELMRQMGEVTGSDLFETLYQEIEQRPGYPDLSRVMSLLGIDLVVGKVVLSADAVHRQRREWIMSSSSRFSRLQM